LEEVRVKIIVDSDIDDILRILSKCGKRENLVFFFPLENENYENKLSFQNPRPLGAFSYAMPTTSVMELETRSKLLMFRF